MTSASCEVSLTYGLLTLDIMREEVPNPSVVKSVDLSGSNIDPQLCIQLVQEFFVKMPLLEVLDMKDNRIGEEGAVALFQALREHCPKLTYLDVNENAIQDDAMYDLALLVASAKLTTLNVVTNHITPRGLPTLCDGILVNTMLTEVSLAFNLLGDDGACTVAEMLAKHCSLRTLDLSDNRIGDRGAVALAQAFILSSRSKLESLNLSVNHIGDVGFRAIGEALTSAGNRHLTALDLACNDAVRDEGRHALIEAMPSMRYIYSIDLTSCDLSDGNAVAITGAIQNERSSLCSIEWFNNPRICLATEKALYEAIEAKKVSVERRSVRHWNMGTLVTCVLIPALMVSAAVFIRSRRAV